jgi:hypothetical protein
MSPQNQNYANRPQTPVMGNPNNIGNMIPSNIGSVLPTIPNQNTMPSPNNNLSPQGQNLSGSPMQNLSGSPMQPRPGSPLSQPPESRSLDYRKLPNPTKGFGDKAQRRITTLFTKRYESQSGSPIPRPEEEFVVC